MTFDSTHTHIHTHTRRYRVQLTTVTCTLHTLWGRRKGRKSFITWGAYPTLQFRKSCKTSSSHPTAQHHTIHTHTRTHSHVSMEKIINFNKQAGGQGRLGEAGALWCLTWIRLNRVRRGAVHESQRLPLPFSMTIVCACVCMCVPQSVPHFH